MRREANNERKGEGTAMDAKQAINEGLEIYRNDMQILIRKQLQAAHGGNWCLEKVVPILSPHKRSLITQKLGKGESPEHQVDVSDFERVIKEFGDLFPQPIRQGEHHHRFKEITDARNEWAHPSGATPRRADAEAILAACSDVLRQCSLLSSAQAIEDIVRDLGRPSLSAPPNQEVATTPPNRTALGQSPVSASPERLEIRKTGESQRLTSDHRTLVLEGLDIYCHEMRFLIRKRLQAAYGQNWYQEKVLPLYVGGRRARAKWLWDEGRTPESLIDVNDFPRVIQKCFDLFPEDVGALLGLSRTIANRRNNLVHHVGREFTTRDGEALLDASSDVLRRCGLASAAADIDAIARQLGPAS